MTLQIRTFSLEGIEDTVFEGYSTGDMWNGWECPLFSFEVAQQLMTIFNKLGLDNMIYKPDSFICKNLEDLPESESFEGIMVEDQKLYPIGAYCWCWREAEEMSLADMNEMDAKHPDWQAPRKIKM